MCLLSPAGHYFHRIVECMIYRALYFVSWYQYVFRLWYPCNGLDDKSASVFWNASIRPILFSDKDLLVGYRYAMDWKVLSKIPLALYWLSELSPISIFRLYVKNSLLPCIYIRFWNFFEKSYPVLNSHHIFWFIKYCSTCHVLRYTDLARLFLKLGTRLPCLDLWY